MWDFSELNGDLLEGHLMETLWKGTSMNLESRVEGRPLAGMTGKSIIARSA